MTKTYPTYLNPIRKWHGKGEAINNDHWLETDPSPENFFVVK